MLRGRLVIGYLNEFFVGKGIVFVNIMKELLCVRMWMNRVNELEEEWL